MKNILTLIRDTDFLFNSLQADPFDFSSLAVFKFHLQIFTALKNFLIQNFYAYLNFLQFANLKFYFILTFYIVKKGFCQYIF